MVTDDSVLHLDACRGGGLQGVTGFQSAPAFRKALRRFLRFTRGTDSLQRPVPVDPQAPILIGTVRRWADDLDEIAVRLERKSRYAAKGLLIEHKN